MKRFYLVVILLFTFSFTWGMPLGHQTQVKQFINQMVSKHNFDRAKLVSLFNSAQALPSVIAKMKKPYEAKPWYIYRKHFLSKNRINGGVNFWQQHNKTLSHVKSHYGVPANIIVAVIGVESSYGKHLGKYQVFSTLATLAFDYPPRAKFFRRELAQFLLLTREQGLDPQSIYGSYAGAIGQPQFMPSSYRHYAIDYSKDGKIDLVNNTDDVIASIASYLKRHGWQANQPIAVRAQIPASALAKIKLNTRKPSYRLATLRKYGIKPAQALLGNPKVMVMSFRKNDNGQTEYWLGLKNFYVITRYNTSRLYALAVYQLAHQIAQQHHQQA